MAVGEEEQIKKNTFVPLEKLSHGAHFNVNN